MSLTVLTPEEAMTLNESLDPVRVAQISNPYQIRIAAAIHLMLQAGLRVGEVCGLIRSDLVAIDQPVKAILVRAEIAKRARAREVPVNLTLHRMINLLIASGWIDAPDMPLSPAIYHRNPYLCISPRTLQRRVAAVTKSIIGRSIHPHALRHTFATAVLRKSNIRIVQTLLGHKNLSSTQIYTHPNSYDLETAVHAIDYNTPNS